MNTYSKAEEKKFVQQVHEEGILPKTIYTNFSSSINKLGDDNFDSGGM